MKSRGLIIGMTIISIAVLTFFLLNNDAPRDIVSSFGLEFKEE